MELDNVITNSFPKEKEFTYGIFILYEMRYSEILYIDLANLINEKLIKHKTMLSCTPF